MINLLILILIELVMEFLHLRHQQQNDVVKMLLK